MINFDASATLRPARPRAPSRPSPCRGGTPPARRAPDHRRIHKLRISESKIMGNSLWTLGFPTSRSQLMLERP